jgi:hypothetical protein
VGGRGALGPWRADWGGRQGIYSTMYMPAMGLTSGACTLFCSQKGLSQTKWGLGRVIGKG